MIKKQDLKAFAAGVIQRTKNEPRAVFAVDGVFKDVPQDGQYYGKILKSYPNSMIGVYDTKAEVNWLLSDLTEANK